MLNIPFFTAFIKIWSALLPFFSRFSKSYKCWYDHHVSRIPTWIKISALVSLLLILIGVLIWIFFWFHNPSADEPSLIESFSEASISTTEDEALMNIINIQNQELRNIFEDRAANSASNEYDDFEAMDPNPISFSRFGSLNLPGEYLPLENEAQSLEKISYETYTHDKRLDFYADIRQDYPEYVANVIASFRNEGLDPEIAIGDYDNSPTTVITIDFPDHSLERIYLINGAMGIKRIDILFYPNYDGLYEVDIDEIISGYHRF